MNQPKKVFTPTWTEDVFHIILLICLVLFFTACAAGSGGESARSTAGPSFAFGQYAPKNWDFCTETNGVYSCTTYPVGTWPVACNGIVGAWAGGAFQIVDAVTLFNGISDDSFSYDGTNMVWYPSGRQFSIEFQNVGKTEMVLEYSSSCAMLYEKQ